MRDKIISNSRYIYPKIPYSLLLAPCSLLPTPYPLSPTLSSSSKVYITIFPNETKYYDKYQASSGTTISSLTACSGGICYGHALSETANWYNDGAVFVIPDGPWVVRGGGLESGAIAGVWYSEFDDGDANYYEGFRSVALVGT